MRYGLEYLEGLEPAQLGISCFDTYRDIQLEALEKIVYGERRFSALSLPTGSGKSGVAFSAAKYTGLRTVILTATLGLQTQYLRDFNRDGLVDIRGRSNYQCIDFEDSSCLEGGVRGCRCTNGGGCEYERARDRARNSECVITSYAYWLVANDKATGLERSERDAQWKGENPVEMLICDEGDAGRQWLEDYLSVRVHESEIKRWVDTKEVGDDPGFWRSLASAGLVEIKEEVKAAKARVRAKTKGAVEEYFKLERLQRKLERIEGMDEGEWVIERRDGTRWGRMWCFDVVWPGRYAERYLFCGVPKVVLMSATLRPKEMSLLGVGKEEYEFREWGRVFPANRHAIYSCPARKVGEDGKLTDVRIDHRTSERDLELWVERIDEIIDGRLDRKGLIHTVSYDRQRFLMNHSRHAGIMVGNTADPESESATEIMEMFRKSEAPRLLVSPSFARGWDMPGEVCEYGIIVKIPFAPSNGKVAKAREERDKSYGSYLAMQTMVQSAGRGMRSAEDRFEVLCVDGHLTWFLNKNKTLAPEWFAGSVRRVNKVPVAAPKL